MKNFLKIIFKIFVVAVIVATLFNVRIKNVEVIGNTKQTNEEVEKSIFTKDYEKISVVCLIKNLFFHKENLLHIEKYDIEWVTPFSIKLIVYEKEDIGYIKSDIKNVYFDKDGVVSSIDEKKRYDIPEIRGISASNFKKGEKIKTNNKNLLSIILNISSFAKENLLPLSLIEIGNAEKISIYVDSIKVELGDIKNMEVKLQRFKDIYPEIKDLSGILDLSMASDNMLDEKYIFKKTG